MLTRDSKLLLGSTLLNSIPVGYMNVVPLVYLAEIGYDPSVIGLIYAASAVANTAALIPCGLLADRYGRKKFLIAGSALPALSYAIFGLTLDPAWLVVASVVGGVGFAGGLAYSMVNPAIVPMIAASTTERSRTALFGVVQGTWTLALSIGAFLSILPGALARLQGLDALASHYESYLIMSGVMIVSVVPLLFVKEVRNVGLSSVSLPSVMKRRTIRATMEFPVTSWGRIMKFFAAFIFTGLGLGIIVQLMPTWYALRFGASEGLVGQWTALANLVSIITIPIIPRLAKRNGTLSSSAYTGLVGALFLGSMPLVATFESSALLFVARTVFETMSWAMLQSYMMGVVEDRERATTVGFAYTAWGIGASVGTSVGGGLLGARMLVQPFAVGVASYAIASVMLPAMFRKVRPREE